MRECDPASLVARACDGDADAWEALYARVYPKLFAYARSRLDSPDEARDAVSEAVTRAVAGLPCYRGDGGGFDAWMVGIIRHVVLDMHRDRERRRTPLGAAPSDNGNRPLERMVEVEDAAELRAAFERLSPSDQEILDLRTVAGLSPDEVARALGRRSGAVRMAHRRALHRLRMLLDEEGRNGH